MFIPVTSGPARQAARSPHEPRPADAQAGLRARPAARDFLRPLPRAARMPAPICGAVRLRERAVNPLQYEAIAHLAMPTFLAPVARAARQWLAPNLLPAPDDDLRVRILDAAIAHTAYQHLISPALEWLHAAWTSRTERRHVEGRHLDGSGQLQRIVELANHQPLNTQGLHAANQRILALVSRGEEQVLQGVAPRQAADAMAALADHALNLGRLGTPLEILQAKEDVGALVLGIRFLLASSNLTPEDCASALEKLGRTVDRRLQARADAVDGVRQDLGAFIATQAAITRQTPKGRQASQAHLDRTMLAGMRLA